MKLNLCPVVNIGLCGALIMLTGCFTASKPTQYYLLSAMGDNGTVPRADFKNQVSIEIEAIHFPEYLSNDHIMSREGRATVAKHEFDRWAEDLNSSFERVLVENLSQLLGSPAIYGSGSRKGLVQVDYQLTIDLFRFEITERSEALLKARYSLKSTSQSKGPTPTIVQYHIPVPGIDREAQVQALSQALFEFSNEIAGSIGR